jgi:hypothetical protein
MLSVRRSAGRLDQGAKGSVDGLIVREVACHVWRQEDEVGAGAEAGRISASNGAL